MCVGCRLEVSGLATELEVRVAGVKMVALLLVRRDFDELEYRVHGRKYDFICICAC